MAKTPKFYDTCRDAEQLTYTTIEEAIEAFVSDLLPTDLIPETIEVHGFCEMELPAAERLADRVLSDIIEYLDDEFGDQIDGGPSEITPTLRTAALAFANTLRAEYPVWSCEHCFTDTVRVADYVEVPDAH